MHRPSTLRRDLILHRPQVSNMGSPSIDLFLGIFSAVYFNVIQLTSKTSSIIALISSSSGLISG